MKDERKYRKGRKDIWKLVTIMVLHGFGYLLLIVLLLWGCCGASLLGGQHHPCSLLRRKSYCTHIGIPTMESVKLLQLCTGLCSRSKKHTWLLHLQQQVPGSTGNNFYRQHHEALTLTPVSLTTERCPVWMVQWRIWHQLSSLQFDWTATSQWPTAADYIRFPWIYIQL